MSILMKNLLVSAVVGSLALVGAVTAQEEVKHKTIEIKAVKDSDVSVWIDSDGSKQTVVLTADELANGDLLEDKLAGLDEQTKETVMQALQGINIEGEDQAHNKIEKVFVMNRGDGNRVEFIGDEADIDIEMIVGEDQQIVRKHIISADEAQIVRKQIISTDETESILKGHTGVISKLIERGEFTQEELDVIQAAIDAKR